MRGMNSWATPFKLALPVLMGLFPIGATIGLLGYQQNLSFAFVFGLSALIYAGSSQLAVLGLLADGIFSPFQVFITVWLINLRHVVLSLAYLPHVRKWSFLEKFRFFPLLTDETFALLISSTEKNKKDPNFSLKLELVTYINWLTATATGFWFGSFLPDPKKFGLDFTMAALIIGIVMLFLKRIEHVVTFFLAIFFTFIFFTFFQWGRFSIISGAILASLIGAHFQWKRSLA